MSEVQTRPPPRGRGSGRGGRGGYGSRGARGARHSANGDKTENKAPISLEDEGEIGELKMKYSNQLRVIREMFPDWTQEDLVFALQETNGDLESTIERITEGSVSQWGEVKKKDRSRSKVKEPSAHATESTTPSTGRGGRGRGSDAGRGGRGRGSERGRGGARGSRGGSALPSNGTKQATSKPVPEAVHDTSAGSVPTEESNAWDGAVTTESISDGWVSAEVPPIAATETTKSSVIPEGTKKSWASMFAKPVAPPAPKTAPKKASETGLPAAESIMQNEPEALPPPVVEAFENTPIGTPHTDSREPSINITPSKDALTEGNVEQLPDVSGPVVSATAASTVATSKDPRGTPLTGTNSGPATRPPISGYAASAHKAAGTPGRNSSFQRRVLEQQEAVVMPGNHAVDRTAVQFGSLGLNGSSEDPDVDEDREEAETRAQPPQHSPIAHPRASLPPIAQGQTSQSDANPSESVAPTQMTSLPPAPQQAQSISPQPSGSQGPLGPGPPGMSQQPSQGSHPYNQFGGRYGQAPLGQEQTSGQQKPFDAFGQPSSQAPAPATQYENYPGQSQPSHAGGLSSASSDYPSYYTSENQQRPGFPNYYQSGYGQQGQHGQQEAGSNQQRSGSGIGQSSSDTTTQYPSTQTQPHSRFGQAVEAQGSGHNTPGAGAPGAPGAPSSQSQSQMQHQSQGQAGAYPYGHPYYSSPYYAAYMSQFGYGQGGYGAPFGGKGSMYGQHHQGYGMSPQNSYDQSSSPANLGGFGQPSSHGRESGLGGAASTEYGRSGSAQQQQQGQQSSGAGGFGMPDVFGRSGYSGPNQQQTGQQGGGGGEDSLKPFGDSKPPGGPSPSLNQPGRPGSATQTSGSGGPQNTSGLPPPPSQQNQPGYGGYPSHLNHQLQNSQGGQYGGGLGGLGGHQGGQQNHQSGQYGSYGSQFNSYYGSGSGGRGGWGGNYGGH